MDRGFELMIPKQRAHKESKYIFANKIKFTIFRREFSFYFSVKQKGE